jgi:thiol-disulfide isomerase/thioredoxin
MPSPMRPLMRSLSRPVAFSARVALTLAVAATGFAAAPLFGQTADVKQAAEPAVTLKVGDTAPPLKVGKWVKGEAVKSFQPGTVYVMEFWATWCGPCRAAIPHVTELQHKYKDKVVVIGQNVWEEDEKLVEPFVQQMGDKMDYRVVTDDKSTSARGAMADTWMQAAGKNGIPCSFIVDQQGKIAWIGHPMAMADVLAQVVEGKFDPTAQAGREAAAEAAQKKVMEAMNRNDIDGAISAIDELAKVQPEIAPQLPMIKFSLLLRADKYDKAYAMADDVYGAVKDNPQALNELAWTIATEESIKQRDLKTAERFAARAVELTKREEGAILDTLARVQFDQGKVDEAIATQTEAVAKAEPDQKSELQATLDKYKAAKK